MTIADAEDAEAIVRRFGSTNLTPWLDRHRKELNRTLQCQPHEHFDHPLAILVAVTSSNPDPMGCFRELASEHHLPAGFHTVRCTRCRALLLLLRVCRHTCGACV